MTASLPLVYRRCHGEPISPTFVPVSLNWCSASNTNISS
jgi:hypothetical protein